MLPDPAEVRERIRKALTLRVRQAVRKHMGPLDDIRHTTIHEGHTGLHLHRADGSEGTGGTDTIEAGFNMTREEAEDFQLDLLLGRMDEVARKMADQMKSNFYRTISKAVEEVGNVVDNKGKPVTPEVLLESLRRIQTDFDEDGRPHIPQIHCGPQLKESLEKAWSLLTTDPTYKQQLIDLIEQKRREWNDREADRALAG